METSVLTYEDTSVLNSGLDAFPPTYFLSEPDHSNHSFCLSARCVLGMSLSAEVGQLPRQVGSLLRSGGG